MGAESAAHAARRYLLGAQSAEKVLLKIDFRNAFNTARRDVILTRVREKLPDIYHFVFQAYALDSDLYFGEYTLQSSEGVQQGDPLGPLLFCLALQPLIDSCRSELNLWYLDDGTIGGDVELVLEDFTRIIDAGTLLGLHIHPSKCELVVCNGDQAFTEACTGRFKHLAPDIRIISPDDVSLMGAPLSPNGIDKALREKLDDLRTLASRLKSLDAHDAFFILKNCLALPKLVYVLRSSPCFGSPVLQEYDSLLRSALGDILNVQLSDSAWEQASMPVRFGGVGVRAATAI